MNWNITKHPLRIALPVAVIALSLLIHGADLIAAPKTLKWAGCGISKKAFMQELATAFEAKTGVHIDMKGGGATKGIRSVADKSHDLGGTCRSTLVSPDTMAPHAEERRVRLDPVAWDALVVIVHQDNPVSDITLEQIRQVYTGEVNNWAQLGGRDAPIDLYVRQGKISGVGRTVRELIFQNYEQEFTDKALVVRSSGPLEKAIESDAKNGVAITGVSSARKRNVKILNLEGKEASYDNIKNGNYLLYRPLYLVTHLQNMDKDVWAFSNFAHSEEGREIMRNVGTVPYEDAIDLWLKYLAQTRKAQESGLGQ